MRLQVRNERVEQYRLHLYADLLAFPAGGWLTESRPEVALDLMERRVDEGR